MDIVREGQELVAANLGAELLAPERHQFRPRRREYRRAASSASVRKTLLGHGARVQESRHRGRPQNRLTVTAGQRYRRLAALARRDRRIRPEFITLFK